MHDNYKYDIAISLCNEDAAYARNLKAQLNPGLKVFFYEDNQEQIISQSGPEVFASVFKEARVVVILSRKEWGQSFYTELEMHSITDRYKKEGLSFLVVVPMVPGEKPAWYPETMIYANPVNLPIETIAKIVEYRLTQSGGMVKALTLEEVHESLLQRVQDKKKLVELQVSREAIESTQAEFKIVQELAIQKRDYIKKTGFWNFQEQMCYQPFEFYFMIDAYLLEIKMQKPDEQYQKIVSSQDYTLLVQLYSVSGGLNNLYEQTERKKLLAGQGYKYLYSDTLKGWCMPYVNSKQVSKKEEEILYRQRDSDSLRVTYWHYNLKEPVNSERVVDSWFQELIKRASARINQYV